MGHQTEGVADMIAKKVNHLTVTMGVADHALIFRGYIKAIFFEYLALYADLGGWIVNKSYAHPRPLLKDLLRFDDAPQSTEVSD
eukprot:SAG22_NODE_3976_length_1442_cov_1.434847_1_plen_84_part_00